MVHERVSIAEELRAGIDRDELELYYQPQVTVATGQIVGVEALVRWNHPRLGQLTPGAFLPAAERTGVIVPLGAWVLDKACRQFRQWRDQGVEPPVISVNLSGSQLKLGRDFYHDVQKTLLKWGLAPRDLEFDVPESVLSDAFGANPDVLQKLHELGVRIAIDDFGAEYTSIGRLKAYQIKRLKIAPQLIKSMTFNPADAGAVRLMLHLASQLGIEIIAKSVETEEQQAFLLSTAEGANAQGFFYSKPLARRAGDGLLAPEESGVARYRSLASRACQRNARCAIIKPSSVGMTYACSLDPSRLMRPSRPSMSAFRAGSSSRPKPSSPSQMLCANAGRMFADSAAEYDGRGPAHRRQIRARRTFWPDSRRRPAPAGRARRCSRVRSGRAHLAKAPRSPAARTACSTIVRPRRRIRFPCAPGIRSRPDRYRPNACPSPGLRAA